MSDETHTIKARCWKCQKTFHILVLPTDKGVKGHYVLKIVDCNQCDTPCQVTLREDQISSVSIHRDIRSERRSMDPAPHPTTIVQTTKPDEDKDSENSPT